MTTQPDKLPWRYAAHYYPPGWDADPYVCEIRGGYVYLIGDDSVRRIEYYQGRFVRLQEVEATAQEASEGEARRGMGGLWGAMRLWTVD